jgi:hypothetical protein
MDDGELKEAIKRAIWAGDTDELWRIAPCRCCCHEHTFREGCPAFAWGGCRGQFSPPRNWEEGWAEFYAKTRGMSRAEFFGEDP